MSEEKTCHDCGCKEGELHDLGCDMERCPFCGGQLITCGCRYEAVGYDYDRSKPMSGLPRQVYEKGLNDDENRKFVAFLSSKGRVPYIVWPNMCRRCGALWPDMFSVPDEEWRKYVQISRRACLLCRPCYDTIKQLIDERAKEF